MSESDFYSNQILKSEVDPRTVRVKLFIMAVGRSQRYLNETERANKDIHADFQLKITL